MSERTYNVLIAEDETFQRLAILDILSMCEYEAVAVENGKLALDELKNETNDFDLVLLDLMMPEVDGYQATQQLRQDPRYQELPIIALTAKAMPDDQERCIAAGANDYIPKPLDVEMLLSLIRVWMPK